MVWGLAQSAVGGPPNLCILSPSPQIQQPFLAMMTYSLTYNSPSASVRGWADPSIRDNPAYSHDSQPQATAMWRTSVDVQANFTHHNSSSQSSPNQGVGGSTPDNEGFQPPPFTSPGENPEQPFFECTICSTRCTQERVLERHYDEKHRPDLLIRCSQRPCRFLWIRKRKYRYREHLKKKHGQEDKQINKELGLPRRPRGKGRVIESDPPGPPPLLAVEEDTNHASPPVIPLAAYNPQLVHAGPQITTTVHEDTSGSEHLASTIALSSSELGEYTLLNGNFKIHDQFRIPTVDPGGSTADIPPNPGTPQIPALPSPVGGYHASPVSWDPRSTDGIYTPVTDTNTVTFAALGGYCVDIDQLQAPGWGQLTISNGQYYIALSLMPHLPSSSSSQRLAAGHPSHLRDIVHYL